MPEFPRFRVSEIEHSPVRLIGELSSTSYVSETWVQAGWIGYLRVGNHFFRGRWAEAGSSWAFSPENPSALKAIGGLREFDVFDGYWGERAELILGQTLNWRESILTEPSNHDHCGVCWATISANENTRHFAASAKLLVCAGCYASFVQPRKIDFSGMGFSGTVGPAD